MDRFSGAVLAVGVPAEAREAVAALDAVASVGDADAAAAALEAAVAGSAADDDGTTTDRPECVVVGHDPPALDAVALTEAVAGVAPSVPVVVYAAADSDALAADAVAAGATGYVPARRGPSALGSAVARAIERGRERVALERDRSILDGILEQAPLEIAAKDTEARHVRSTRTVSGQGADGKTETEWRDDDRSTAIEAEDERFLRTRERIVDKLVEYDAGDHKLDAHDSGWLNVWRYPWRDDDRFRGVIAFTQDITGAEQTRRELTEKNKLLGQFASVVTHDLRNPLNAAAGSLDLLEEPDDPQQAEIHDRIDRSLDRMEEIIDDLVRLTRDSGRDSALTSLELATEARRAWETVETGGATLRVEAGPERIIADEGQLRQIFENLYRNSVEHGSDVVGTHVRGDVADELTVTVGLTDGGFYVADDGSGLPDDVKNRLNAGEFNEGGLGLNIVRTITDRHDWVLQAGDSAEGGARFDFLGCRIIRHPYLRAAARESRPLIDHRAIGPGAEGDARHDDGVWTVEGRGRNFWRNINECYLVSGPVEGDAELVGQVTAFESPRIHSKAGLVMTGARDEDSPHCFAALTGGKGSEILWQLEDGGGTQSQVTDDGVETPYWYRIRRAGDVVIVAVSSDGRDWQAIAEQELPLGEEAFYGLAVTSHEANVSATATFEDVSLDAVTWK